MHFRTIALSLFAAATATAQNAASDSLPELVAQLPTCAIGCLNSAADSASCEPTDFECICGDNRQSFITSIGACVYLGGQCSQDEISRATDLAPQICNNVANNPEPSAVASASNLVSDAIASETASPTDEPDAAVRPGVGLGMIGIGMVAALVL
ncbi:hypothetical protein DL766_009574 [Monosporascus sp. MC13-8B]|uniref:CFEM domain-containing protein n=1 Tax=Monosporascus cannonballus TaxID=155416 RepID=A0ABY0HK08_9PEZI|nr:hypothetical protein DL762_000159 [Monosporascus cannonballus]RYO97335.1 hypothetical protein DL763_002795 [Monosporascus cannonballus]RYP14831.1 hypothetical protein DL766_009574 [Monosporascus sp. MC13-8B]